MKKRKIFVSLALASASLFSLVACGGEDTPTSTPTPVVTTTPAPSTTSTPAPTTTSSTDSRYEELTSTIDMKKDDIPAGKSAKDIVKGVFTIVAGSELRERTRTWTNPADSTDSIIFERSIKMGDDTAALKVNVAPGTDRVLSVYVQNGSSSANTQKIKVTKPDGTTYTIEYAGNKEFGGYPGSSVVVKIDIEVTDGEWKIQRNSGTTDLYAATLTGKFEKSEITGFEVADEGKTEYMVGEDYSSLDVVVNAVYGNGRRDQLARTDYTVDTSEVDMNTAGTYPVKINYKTYEAKTINITVTALSDVLQLGFYRIEKLSKNTTAGNGVYYNQSVKLVYNVGEELDKADLSIKTQSTDGNKTFDIDKDDANLTISNVDMTTAGEKTVTVSYELGGVTATSTFKVYVVNTAPSIVGDIVKVKVDKNYTGEIGALSEGFNMFTGIQQALDFLENNEETIKDKKKLISVAAGKYKEKLEINIPYLTIEGAGKGSTVIEWDSLYGQADEGGFTHTTDSTQTVAVRESAVNCSINNLTISNYWNNYTVFDEAFGANYGEHRALALLVQSDKFRMENAKLLGYQDTVEFFTGRQYLKECDIYGTTDFIFGTNNTTLFDNCLIHTIDTGKQKDGELQQAPVDGGYTTAFKGNNKDANDYVEYGAIFYSCTFEADPITAASHQTSLGRPWGAYAAVAYINCNLGEHFSTIGYNNSSKNQRYVSMNAEPTAETVKFVEYGNTGPGAVYYATVEGTETKLYGGVAYVTAGEEVTANTYYELVMEGSQPKKNADGTYTVKLTEDTTFQANKYYFKAVTVSGYKFLTEAEAANYTNYAKIYGETNGKVTYQDSWDPSAEVTIKADSNTYYKFDEAANATGTSYVMPTTFALPIAGDPVTNTAKVGDMTFDATNGKIAYNANSHCVNMKSGAKLSFHVEANTKVTIKTYSYNYGKYIVNGVEPTTDTLIQFYATATDVELVSTGDTYISYITISPDATAPDAATLTDISLEGAPANEFAVGTDYDLSTLVVKALYNNNSAVTLASTDYEIDDATVVDKNTAGTYEVTVTYQGKTAKFNIVYVASVSDTFDSNATIDFSSSAALALSLQNNKITYADGFTYNDHSDSIQLQSATSSFSFKVKAGATVTVTSYGGGYGYLLINGATNNDDVTAVVSATSDMTITIAAENSEATGNTWNKSYLKKIEITYKEPAISATELVSFRGKTIEGDTDVVWDHSATTVGGITLSGGKMTENNSYLAFYNGSAGGTITFDVDIPSGKAATLILSYYYDSNEATVTCTNAVTGVKDTTNSASNDYRYSYSLASGTVTIVAPTSQQYLNWLKIVIE